MTVFMSYRREDTAAYAGRLYDRLSEHFGSERIFMDIDHIEPGQDFVEVINRTVLESRTVIVLIGPHWLTVTNDAGQRRLDDPEDFVRQEVAAALALKVPVIPVLVGDATMPTMKQLPEPLAGLSRRNAIEISDTRFHQDVDRLIAAMDKSLAHPAAPETEEQHPARPAEEGSTARPRGSAPPRSPTGRRLVLAVVAAIVIVSLILTARVLMTNPGKSATNFSVQLRGPEGQALGASGAVILDTGSFHVRAEVGPDGQAHFRDLARGSFARGLSLRPEVPGYRPTSETTLRAFPRGGVFEITMARDFTRVAGTILDNPRTRRPLRGVRLNFASGKVIATSDEHGNFQVTLPFPSGHRVPLRLTRGRETGFDDVVTIASDQDLILYFSAAR